MGSALEARCGPVRGGRRLGRPRRPARRGARRGARTEAGRHLGGARSAGGFPHHDRQGAQLLQGRGARRDDQVDRQRHRHAEPRRQRSDQLRGRERHHLGHSARQGRRRPLRHADGEHLRHPMLRAGAEDRDQVAEGARRQEDRHGCGLRSRHRHPQHGEGLRRRLRQARLRQPPAAGSGAGARTRRHRRHGGLAALGARRHEPGRQALLHRQQVLHRRRREAGQLDVSRRRAQRAGALPHQEPEHGQGGDARDPEGHRLHQRPSESRIRPRS